ncbi:MAG: zinc ABC transporter substrate-binding protein [Anaerolineae bacterium]|nr:zinc ABC transporter substrate-binding protein [Anaerolineae bacterium]
MRILCGWMVGVALVLSIGASVTAQSEPLQVMATTSLLADVVARVAGDRASVEALVPADTDAHAYEPTADDALRLSRADLLFTVGAGYEGFIQRLLDNAGAGVPVVAVNDGVAILALAGGETPDGAADPIGILGSTVECTEHSHDDAAASGDHTGDEPHRTDCDPHTWMSPLNVIVWTQNIADALAAADPANADAYHENASLYADELQALDAEIGALVASLSPEKRRLLTNHENMQYFAVRYGFEQVAAVLPGGTSQAEIDPQTLASIIALVRAQGVPVIFVEVTANTALAETLAQDAGIQVVSDLYIEALSGPEGPAPTYLDLMRYNAQRIVGALAGS